MNLVQVLLLAVVQGACELLPVSSSAHVIVTAKLLGLDPTRPEMTLLLVLLHTGTMFAVIVYFWNRWRRDYFASRGAFWMIVRQVVVATVATGVIGGCLLLGIEKVVLRGAAHAEVETLFGNLLLVAVALAAVGVLILFAGRRGREATLSHELSMKDSLWIGAVQGLCLPFRGFSRSGATISTALLRRVERQRAEVFSFALAVVLTPPVVAREVLRLVKAHAAPGPAALPAMDVPAMVVMGAVGMLGSFVAGLLALKWLSRWLEDGRWSFFGCYCLIAATVVFVLHLRGF